MSAVPSTPEVDPEPFDVPVDRPDDYRLVIGDLFCGAGGFSEGLLAEIVDRNRCVIADETGLVPAEVHRHHDLVQEWLAENVYLVGINHWDPAVETFRANHPWARVLNAKVQAVHPPDAFTVVIDGEEVQLRVDVLIAGPSCVPWSKAKGGMASDDQQRMSPQHVAWWLYILRPKHFLLENVEGFLRWGPMRYDGHGEPEMVKDGSMFRQWLADLRDSGYTVEYDTFVAADYGDPQSRKRLFVMGRLDYQPSFPEPTHGPEGDEPHRTAAEIIDWSDPGTSIWTRDRDHPRVHTGPKYKTMRRIAEGIRRHCDDRIESYADALDWLGRVSDRDEEKHDVDEGDFRTVAELREDVVPIEDAAEAADARDTPFLVRGTVPEVVADGEADGQRHGLCVPYLLGQNGGSVARDVTERPCPTVATGGAISLIDPEPLILPRNGIQRGYYSNGAYPAAEEPLHTVTAQNTDGHLVSPYLVPFYGEREGQPPRTHDIDDPLPTVPASEIKQGLVRPFLISYYNNSTATDVEEPVPTVTTRDRHALIVPEAFPWGLDLRFRLLKPSELKQAQGFDEEYELVADTKETKTGLIGNAVPVGMAQSMCQSLLEPTDQPTLHHHGETPQPVSRPEGGVGSDD